MFTKRWLVDAAERSVKSFAQGVLATYGQDVSGVDLFHASILRAAEAGVSLAVLSVLMSIASAKVAGMSPASLAPPV